jgi:hypothetical protein
MQFKKGSFITLTDSVHFAAELGALAIAIKEYDGEFIEVEWICEKGGYQQNGSYYPGSFRLATEEEIEKHLNKHVNP